MQSRLSGVLCSDVKLQDKKPWTQTGAQKVLSKQKHCSHSQFFPQVDCRTQDKFTYKLSILNSDLEQIYF